MKIKQIRVDGYKNLINCELNLGDFNILVGPNNSGKSNLLEAIQLLFPICFGDEELRNKILSGTTLPPRFTSSISHLKKYEKKPLNIGIGFEIKENNKLWRVDYDVTTQCNANKEISGFLKESLAAKLISKPLKPGKANSYILREGKELKVKEKGKTTLKKYLISKNNSSLLAIPSLYADFEGLSPEFKLFYDMILKISTTRIFSISPKAIRNSIYLENDIDDMQVTSFDLSLIADTLQKENKYYDLFKESLCDILGIESAYFEAEDVSPPKTRNETNGKTKRIRVFALKRKGDRFALIDEYSDGTLVVIAILEALLLEKTRGPILCLEELENCLHPAVMEKMLRFLQDHSDKWPVLITTHSPYLLNGVRPEDVHVAVVDNDGATHFEKVENSVQLRNYLNKNLFSFGELLINNFQDFIGKQV